MCGGSPPGAAEIPAGGHTVQGGTHPVCKCVWVWVGVGVCVCVCVCVCVDV